MSANSARDPVDRFAPTRAGELSASQRGAREEIVHSRGRVPAPFEALVRSPDVARAFDRLSTALWSGVLPKRIGELALLMSAYQYRCRFLWMNHVAKAREAGLTASVIDAIGRGSSPPPTEDADILAAWAVIESMQPGHQLADDLFERACACFTEQGVVELVAFCGFAASVAMLLQLRQVPLPPDGSCPF